MAQIGSEDKPFMLHPKGAVSKESRFRKGFNKIKNDILKDNFPWYFNHFKVNEGDGQIQFTHVVWRNGELNSSFKYLVDIVLLKLKAKKIIRAKFNLTWKTDKILKSAFHADTSIKSKTAIIYFNTNNGKTIFKNTMGKADSF